ncbi:MAG: hypothetical protein AABY26_02315 [Nanoarchaeota archaeon]
MKSHQREKLSAKGWSEKEIQHAEGILEKAEPHNVFFSRMVFWTVVVVIILANLLVSFVLIPFLLFLSPAALYLTIVLLAGTMGFIYNFLITDIRHLEKKHHLLAGIIVPIIGLANLLIVVRVSNYILEGSPLAANANNPWLIGVVFAAVFILPSVLEKIFGKK